MSPATRLRLAGLLFCGGVDRPIAGALYWPICGQVGAL